MEGSDRVSGGTLDRTRLEIQQKLLVFAKKTYATNALKTPTKQCSTKLFHSIKTKLNSNMDHFKEISINISLLLLHLQKSLNPSQFFKLSAKRNLSETELRIKSNNGKTF